MFMVKHLTLVPSQKKELENECIQDDFLKEFECVPGYKLHFDFKSKMQALQISQKTSLVLFFKLMDEIMKVKMEVDDTLEGCEPLVLSEDRKEAFFLGR